MCTSFQRASTDLCNSLNLVAQKICTTYVDPQGVAALTANRLIGLDKCPGVRPIGVGEIVRRIISKAVLYVIKSDVLEAARSLQLCSGHETGCEAAIHSMCRIFHDAMTEAVLLVDADNAFNSLNRKVALLNIHQLCPSLATILTNTYRENASLFIDGDSFLSGRNNPESHGHTCYRNCSLDQEIAEHKYYAGLVCRRCYCRWHITES